MTFVLTLIAGPDGPALDDNTADRAVSGVAHGGGQPGDPDWLAPGLALDIPFDGPDPAAVAVAVREALAGTATGTATDTATAVPDIAVQPVVGRRCRALLADMESTMIVNELLDDLGAAAGRGAEITAITNAAMRGEVRFAESLRRRVGMLAGLPEAALAEAAAGMRLSPGAGSLVVTMRSHGAWTALVSGGFSPFPDIVADALGFDETVANGIEIVDGHLTGRVVEPVLDGAGKKAALLRIARGRGIDPATIMAVGDGANDIMMLGAAGCGVAWRARPAVADAASIRIDRADLRALLWIQGYRADEILELPPGGVLSSG